MDGTEDRREIVRKAVIYAAALCARSEQCTFDIRNKLRTRNLDSAETEHVLSYLQERRYVDDIRYASAFVRTKSRLSGWGIWKIKRALTAKHIPSHIIDKALEEADPEDYLESARKAARTKAKKLNLNVSADRIRLYRHLQAKGFDSSLISIIIKELTSEIWEICDQ